MQDCNWNGCIWGSGHEGAHEARCHRCSKHYGRTVTHLTTDRCPLSGAYPEPEPEPEIAK